MAVIFSGRKPTATEETKEVKQEVKQDEILQEVIPQEETPVATKREVKKTTKGRKKKVNPEVAINDTFGTSFIHPLSEEFPIEEIPMYSDESGAHGMGAILKDSSEESVSPTPTVESTTPDKATGEYIGERMCPNCGTQLNYNTDTLRYECGTCGWNQELNDF